MSEERFDLVDSIIRFESGELDAKDTLVLFQYLVDTGTAWSLQGSYGRAAANLLRSGMVYTPDETDRPDTFTEIAQVWLEAAGEA